MNTAGLVMVPGTKLYGTLRSHKKLPDGLNDSLRFQQALYELANTNVQNIRVLVEGYDTELHLVNQHLHTTTIQKFGLGKVLRSIIQSSRPAWRIGRAQHRGNEDSGLIWYGGDNLRVTVQAFLLGPESYRHVDAANCDPQQMSYYIQELASTLRRRKPREIVVFGPDGSDEEWRALTEVMAKQQQVSVVYYKTPNLLKALLAL